MTAYFSSCWRHSNKTVADPGFYPGGFSQSACANLLFCNFFCQNLHENKRIWTPGASLAPPWIRQCKKTLYLSCHLWYRSGRRPPYKLKLHVYRPADFCKAGGTKISKTTWGKSSQWCLSVSHQNTLIHAKFSWMKEENHFNLKNLSSKFCDKFWCYILWQILMLH